MFIGFRAAAQTPEIEAGIFFFKQSDYLNAITQFESAIASATLTEPPDRVKCYYYLASSRIYLYSIEADDSSADYKAKAGEKLLQAYN